MLAKMPGGSGDFQSGRFTQDDIFRELEQIFQGSGCYALPCGAVSSLKKDQPEADKYPWCYSSNKTGQARQVWVFASHHDARAAIIKSAN
mgnify:FL=1